MNKIILFAVFTLCLTTIQCMYTPSYWKNLGIDVEDDVYQTPYSDTISIDTICNDDINLNVAPYNYNGTVMSGYLKVGKGNSALGFIFYGRENTDRNQLKNYPVLIWLNGGPGSSSQLGNLMELGPLFIKQAPMKPYQFVKNNYSWVKQYSVLFVDQPIGTGLSFADPNYKDAYAQNMSDVANDFYNALYQLYETGNGCFNKLGIKATQDLIIFGESYAGKYVPAIALKIKRQEQDNNGFLKGLRGAAIGDPFTHPFNILSLMPQYAYNLGLLDYQQRSHAQQLVLNATFQNSRKDWRSLHHSFGLVLDYIVQKSGGVNVYDITKYHNYPTILVTQYFMQPTIQDLFKLNKELVFGSQSSNVYEALYQDFMKPEVALVEELLHRKTHVLVYNGQNDLIVETPGTFEWAERLHHDYAEKFRDTLFSVWKTGGKTSGYYKEAGYLELKTVNNAGHLVPMDQGEAALNLAKTFVNKCTGRKTLQE